MTKLPGFVFALAIVGLSAVAPARAQMTESELVMRLNRLENEVRHLPDQAEQLQSANHHLEHQLRGAQPAPRSPPQRSSAPQPQYAPPPAYPQRSQQQAYPQHQAYPQPSIIQQESEPAPPPRGGRRGDAFDPGANPNAPGAPRTLGNPGTVAAAPPLDNMLSDE